MVSSANTEVIRIVEQTLLLAQRRLLLKLLPPVAMVDSSQQRNTCIKIYHNDADVCIFEQSNNRMILACYSKELPKQWLEGQQNGKLYKIVTNNCVTVVHFDPLELIRSHPEKPKLPIYVMCGVVSNVM